jgi:hypothetical protein
LWAAALALLLAPGIASAGSDEIEHARTFDWQCVPMLHAQPIGFLYWRERSKSQGS